MTMATEGDPVSKRVPTINVLRAARKLVANPNAWTRGVPARNLQGVPTYVDSMDAAYWCAEGALLLSARELGLTQEDLEPLWRPFSRLYMRNTPRNMYRPGLSLAGVNDVCGRLAVLAVLDSAIRELEAA